MRMDMLPVFITFEYPQRVLSAIQKGLLEKIPGWPRVHGASLKNTISQSLKPTHLGQSLGALTISDHCTKGVFQGGQWPSTPWSNLPWQPTASLSPRSYLNCCCCLVTQSWVTKLTLGPTPKVSWSTASLSPRSYLNCCCCLITQSWVTKLTLSNSFGTPWTVAHQAPLSMGFSRQEYWNGLAFPSPGNLPDPGIKLTSPALADGFFTTELLGKPLINLIWAHSNQLYGYNMHQPYGHIICYPTLYTFQSNRGCYSYLLQDSSGN